MDPRGSTDPTPHDPRPPRRGLILLALTGSLSMIFVDLTVTAVAGPKIGADLGLSPTGIAWIANAYMVALAAAMAIGGRLGDILGKRTTFLAGVLGFAGASALCGAATSAELLIAGRVLQGLSACLMQPASSALVIETFPQGERGRAMGIYIGVSMSFFAIGPVLGGLLSEYAGWRWVFFINLPIALAAIALVLAARTPNRRSEDRSLDLASAGLLAAGLPLAIYALQDGAEADPATGALRILQPAHLAMLAAGAVLSAVFIWRQLRAARPLVRLALLAEPRLRANVLLIGIMQFAMASLVVQGSIYAQDVLGYSAAQAGMSLMPMLIPVILVARRAGKLYDRIGVRPLARFGTIVATLGLATWGTGSIVVSYGVIATGMALLGLGVAFIMSPANTDTLSGVPDETRGQISGIVQTFRQIGGAAGVAFAATVAGVARSEGSALASSIGLAILAGAVVAALGIAVAWTMPDRRSDGPALP
ncbi:MAG: MFS transporter [Planctomycetaceae bacterium]|nr:MFS transporter [Planctomycetaceae bacterium]